MEGRVTIEAVEPLTVPLEGCNKYCMYPILHADIWAVYKKMQSLRWLAEELDFSQDMKQWEALSDNERFFLKMIISYFAASDGLVNANLAERFMCEIEWSNVKAVLTEQMSMECVHAEVYSLLIEKYVSDPLEKSRLFNAMETIPAIAKKAGWTLKWVNGEEATASFAQRMVAACITEGIFFAASFAAIFWVREKGILPGLTQSNDFIARDERSHMEFSALLYRNYITNKLDRATIVAMFNEAVDIEDEFINVAIPCRLIGMNAADMSTYIRYIADSVLLTLGEEPIFNVTNPFPFVNHCLPQKVSFFEARNTNYSRAATSVKNYSVAAIDTAFEDF